MEENEFRDTYHLINELRCPFEKALNARRCACIQSQQFLLAGREGVGCRSRKCQLRCSELLTLLRRNARFALGLTQAEVPLPHNKEIRVQVGGLLGLQKLQEPDSSVAIRVEDISLVVATVRERFSSLETLPFDKIVPSILAFKGRKKR